MLSAIAAEAQLKNDEGYNQYIYVINGVKHIGYGFNLDSVGLSREECDFILANRCSKLVPELSVSFPGYNELSLPRQVVLINLAYNLGVEGLMGFLDFVGASRAQDWKGGADALLASKAAKEEPARIERLAYQWEMDKM
jgi:lysozyme